MTDPMELVGRLEGEPGDCPFCGCDPYHYVDNGVGMERVAVTCCDEGIALFQHGDPVLTEQVLLRREAAACIRDLTEWRDIATAPKDGTEIVIWGPLYGRTVSRWKEWVGFFDEKPASGWCNGWNGEYGVPDEVHIDPTHWLPLPSAPNQAKEAGCLYSVAEGRGASAVTTPDGKHAGCNAPTGYEAAGVVSPNLKAKAQGEGG